MYDPQKIPCLSLQAETHALRVLYEAVHSSASSSHGAPYPSSWEPQSSANTELFEVPQNSPEIQNLIWSVHRAGGTVVKVSISENCSLFCATPVAVPVHRHVSSCTVQEASFFRSVSLETASGQVQHQWPSLRHITSAAGLVKH